MNRASVEKSIGAFLMKGTNMRVLTCEQISDGHPDKICDQIADAIVTDCLRRDPKSRVAIECLIKDNHVIIAGELTSTHKPDYRALVDSVFTKIGRERMGCGNPVLYAGPDIGILVKEQSADIALGVDKGGAGDQGIMYGFATNETPELMPIPFMVATRFLQILRNHPSRMFRADAKAQVSFDYDAGRITTFLCSVQHSPDVEVADFRHIIESIMVLAASEYVLNTDFEKLTNRENLRLRTSLAVAKKLQEAAPEVVFQYSFDFYGVTLSTADEEVHIKNKRIGDEGEEEIRQALDILNNCKRFVLEYCSVSNEVLAKIRDDYRSRTKVVWRVHFGKGSTMTDAEAIRAVYDLTDDNCQDLIYCEDAKYIDIGHNEYLDGVPFVAGMPNLEVIIISGAPVKDLTPFQNCKKLRILEAAFCEYIYDITPLAGCESLEMLNISYTHVTDLSPLDNLNLTRLTAMYYPKSRVPQEEQDRFTAAKPDCTTFFVGDQPYGKAWRYDANNEYLDWYLKVREVFSYDTYPQTPNHTGWYL